MISVVRVLPGIGIIAPFHRVIIAAIELPYANTLLDPVSLPVSQQRLGNSDCCLSTTAFSPSDTASDPRPGLTVPIVVDADL